jgi:hypothetical protein
MSKTNFEKLVRWDADYYKELTEDDCIVCLTEREVYIIGQITDMLRWKRTRWIGDILGLDFDLIASNLEYKLSERMTCQNLSNLVEKIEQLELKIDYIFNETTINEGDTLPTLETLPYDVTTPEQFAEEFSIATESCDEEDKHELYSGIRQFVNYVHNANIDALQKIQQAGNLAAQSKRLISGIPVLGLLPFDEIADYTAFIIDELLDEYEATVDETLLETVTCDLFCIAVASDCNFRLSDAINYYGSKIGTTALDLTASLANVVQFALTGTFSGDQYFYFMTTFQFIAVAVADSYFSVNGMDSYMLQVAAGMNSPDADWMLLCDECPQLYRLHTTNFAYGLGEWTIDTGTLESGRMRGADGGSVCTIELNWNDFDPTWEIRAMKIYYERIGGTSSASDQQIGKAREIANSNTSSRDYFNSNGTPNGISTACGSLGLSPAYDSNFVQLMVFARVNDPSDVSDIYIDKIEILFSINHAPLDAVVTDDGELCS